MRSRDVPVMIEPMSSPSFTLRTLSAIASTIFCTSPTATMSELAMQRWPAQP